MSSRVRLEDGLLFFEKRLVVPKVLQQEILGIVHSNGHFGISGTIQALRCSYFWIKMSRDARLFCQDCLICHQAKPSNSPKSPMELFSLEQDYPGAAVGVDIGTLPWGDGEYRYFLLMVDLFSRLIEIMPHMDDQTCE